MYGYSLRHIRLQPPSHTVTASVAYGYSLRCTRWQVRAFGCLAEELATRLAPAAAAHEAVLQQGLLGLAREGWMGRDVAARPSFAEARAQLEALAGAYHSSL